MNVNRGHLTILAVWFLSVLVSYIFFIPPTTRLSTMLPSGLATIYTEALDRAPLVDAIALVAMSKMAEDPMVDFALASIRKVGNWKGDIYLLTDRSTCFVDAAKTYDIKIISMEPIASLMEIKALKPTLLHYLPDIVQGVLYMDVDIVVTRDLTEFFTDLKDAATRQLWQSVNTDSSSSTSTATAVPPTQEGNNTTVADNTAATAPKLQSLFDFGAFLDAKGHYVGFCSGCDKWHTGVVWLQRPNIPIAVATAEVNARRRRVLSSIKSDNNRRTRKHDNTTSMVSPSSTDADTTKTNAPSATPVVVRSVVAKADTAPNLCMRAWAATLVSGQFKTDQVTHPINTNTPILSFTPFNGLYGGDQ